MTKAHSHNTLRRPRNLLLSRYIFQYYRIFVIVFIWFGVSLAYAKTLHIEVAALFDNKAMLHIEGDQILLSVGEISKHGVKLISANAKAAVIEYEGNTHSYTLGSVVRQNSKRADKNRDTVDIIVYQGVDTMFRTTGSINGYPVNFLVDTGASSVAISSEEARRLGINYKLDGKPTWVTTASGVERASSIMIDRITISGVTIRSVEGLVIDGEEPSTPLLGMSYLKRFKITNDGNMMQLKRKY